MTRPPNFPMDMSCIEKREHTTEDDTFLLHNKGSITSTFTDDWLLTEGENRDKLGEWLKKHRFDIKTRGE